VRWRAQAPANVVTFCGVSYILFLDPEAARHEDSRMARHFEERQRILLVEDDPDVRMLLEHVLRDAGYDVDPVETVAAANGWLQRQDYTLVLADGILSDGSGIAVADDARARGIRTLVITGYMLRVGKEQLERHEFLMKPVRPRELLTAVERRIAATL
jgi:DNA-binding NtrC family response regulator